MELNDGNIRNRVLKCDTNNTDLMNCMIVDRPVRHFLGKKRVARREIRFGYNHKTCVARARLLVNIKMKNYTLPLVQNICLKMKKIKCLCV
jgi:hypothetical protein